MRNKIVKGLKIVGLGIAMWGVTLFWPEINHYLTEQMLIKMVLGLALVNLIYEWCHCFGRPHNHHGAGQDHPSNPTSNSLSPSLPR
jgi:hypothetical protein